MNVFIISGIVGVVVILFGVLIAALFTRLSTVVATSQSKQEQEKSAYNPAVTLGHRIPVKGSQDEQMKAARQEAAKQAAGLPRYGNSTVGQPNLKTASQGLSKDPVTMVKIAAFHTWQGARTGIPAPGAAGPAGPAVAARKAPTPTIKKPEDLLPGRDFPFTPLTEAMSPDERRKATIANAKARSAAIKALKQSGGAGEVGGEEAVSQASPITAAPLAAASTPTPAGEINLVPGLDYPYIEITDSLSPDERRKATIANSKARSAAMKAAKERGLTAEPVAEIVTTAPIAAPVAPAGANAAALSGIPKPDLTPLTDTMSPDERRKATIANSKARSAYMKALKEAGIDPATVE